MSIGRTLLPRKSIASAAGEIPHASGTSASLKAKIVEGEKHSRPVRTERPEMAADMLVSSMRRGGDTVEGMVADTAAAGVETSLRSRSRLQLPFRRTERGFTSIAKESDS